MMSRVIKMNVAGIAVGLAAVTFASSVLAGCAAASGAAPFKSVPGATSPTFSQAALAVSQAQLTDLSQFNQTQINALIGTYQGTLVASDDSTQPYTVVLSKVSVNGKNYPQAVFTGPGMSFVSLMQTVLAPVYNMGTDTSYQFTSLPTNAPSINDTGDGAPVMLQMVLSVTATNVYDPTSPTITFVDTYMAPPYNPLVPFNSSILKTN